MCECRRYPVGSAEEAKLAEEYEINGEGSFCPPDCLHHTTCACALMR